MGHKASQSKLASQMQSSKLPMTFVSSPPDNKVKIYIYFMYQESKDGCRTQSWGSWGMMGQKECGNIVLKVLGKLEWSAVRCWEYRVGNLVYCQQKRAGNIGQTAFVNQLVLIQWWQKNSTKNSGIVQGLDQRPEGWHSMPIQQICRQY